MNEIISALFEMRDEKYRDFNSALIPTVDKNTVIGVRTPQLKKYAKELYKSGYREQIFSELPHKYYEMQNLHAFMICEISDFDECITELNRFLPYVDNWATCDLMRPKSFKKNPEGLLAEIQKWLSSDHTYTVRFGIEMLMTFFLDGNFSPEFPESVAQIRSDEYYINMMIAWYFATALAKQWQGTILYIEQKRLDKWTHNKAIQKAVESYRITDEQKQYLKQLKIK